MTCSEIKKNLDMTSHNDDLSVSIIIPTLNEYDNLKLLLPEIANSLSQTTLTDGQFEIIIVDDEAQDKTKTLLEDLKKNINITYLPSPNKRGLQFAAIEGFRVAKGKILILMDGDGSHQASDLTKLISPILNNESNFVVGSRYIKGGNTENWPILRKAISKINALISKPLTGLNDSGSGFLAFRKGSLNLEELETNSWKLCLNIYAKNKGSIKEVPIVFKNRNFGESKLRLTDCLDYLRHLIKLYYSQSRTNTKD